MRTLRPFALIAAALLALGACGDRPLEPGPPLAGATLAPGAIATAAGAGLVLHEWQPAGRPRAVILALHGFGDTGALTFGDAAAFWATQGIATYAPDQRGFGANPGYARWPGAEALVADAVETARTLRAAHPGLPLVVVGESMGGGVALAAAGRGMPADALVLAAPAVAGGASFNPLLRAAGWALATAAPDSRLRGGGLVSIRPTDNPEALARSRAHPHVFSDASGRELYGLVRLMDLAAAAAPKVTTPTLTLVGANDRLVPAAGIRAVHARIPGAAAILEYPEGWHWLFRDLAAERVWADVAAFVLSPTAHGVPPVGGIDPLGRRRARALQAPAPSLRRRGAGG